MYHEWPDDLLLEAVEQPLEVMQSHVAAHGVVLLDEAEQIDQFVPASLAYVAYHAAATAPESFPPVQKVGALKEAGQRALLVPQEPL